MRHSGAIRWGGRILFVGGLAISGARIATASPEEAPIVIAEEAGGQIGGAAGTALAVSGCLFLGLASGGWGLFLCGLTGGIGGGIVGSGIAGSAAREAVSGDSPCPSCHALQREWERERALSIPGGVPFDTGSIPADSVPVSPTPDTPGAATLKPEELEMIRRWLEITEPAAAP